MNAKKDEIVKEKNVKPEEIARIKSLPQDELIAYRAKLNAEESSLIQGFEILKRKEEELVIKQRQMEGNIANRLAEVLQEKAKLQDISNNLDAENREIESKKSAVAQVRKEVDEALGSAKSELEIARGANEKAQALKQEYTEKVKSLSGDVELVNNKKKDIEKQLNDLEIAKAQHSLNVKQLEERESLVKKANEDIKEKAKVLKHVAELFELAKGK
jgi:chromosome segregation ATPase